MSDQSGENPFRPAWWCPGSHAQTIFGRYFRPVPRLNLYRERLETPEGDFLDVDWLGNSATAPLVVVLHGLEGSSASPYILSLLSEIHKRKADAAVLNLRGCSGEINRLKQTYHSGISEDLDFLVSHFKQRWPERMIHLVGFSLGGNIVLKWLGEQKEGARDKIQRAVAVSVPYDLTRSAGIMDQGFNRAVYTRKLLSTLKVKARLKEEQFPGSLDLKKIKRSRTFREFDREVTAKLNHFKDEKDYWHRSSSCRYLKSIRVETLLVHADDDPFFPGKFFPSAEIIENSGHLKVLMTPRGGHVGFVSGAFPWKQDRWLEKTLANFLFGG